MRVNRALIAAAGLAALALLTGSAGMAAPSEKVSIRILSSRADMVSGGDALVDVIAPKAKYLSAIKFQLNGKDVGNQLAPVAQGEFRGLVHGFKNGANTLSVSQRGGGAASLSVRNYSINGPILSGPHMKPYECRTIESGLGALIDANCNVKTRVDYFYRATDKSFKPLPAPAASSRPTDLAQTTTIDGVTVPYIVRVESGTINRTIYRIAVLDSPINAPVKRWTPGAGWNHRLGVTFGGGAGANYNQGVNQATSVLNDLYLSRGFAFMNATELVNGLHGNAVLQGETLMMLKEHFIEHYGQPKWTVGTGGSGGAIQQLVITEMYPGLLDGLQPSLSFPDSTLHTADCGLLVNYWNKQDAAAWPVAKREAVQGLALNTCDSWNRSFVPVDRAANKPGCGLNDQALIYDPKTNPKGARCAIHEMRGAIYGRDSKTGFGLSVRDNVGLQYGLGALNSGAISVDEFLDLNEKIGGEDFDGNYVAARSVAEPRAIRAAYESGLLNGGGGGLAIVPILHTRDYRDAQSDIHSRERDLVIRARLVKANGDADNEVIWVGPYRAFPQQAAPGGPAAITPTYVPPPPPPAPGANLAALSLDVMTAWLDAIAADPAPLTHAKVVKDKPAEAVDAYFDAAGAKTAEVANWDPNTGFNKMYPVHSEMRMVAGQSMADDVLKCQLKPAAMSDYKVSFTAAQQARLAAIFPKGVCDFTKPGVEQRPLKGTYQRY